jgi:hypothetical protein
MPLHPSTSVPPAKWPSDDHELEWLLCLASSFQACRACPLGESEAEARISPSKPSASRCIVWTHVNPAILIRGAVSSWRKMRSKHRNAA